MGVSIQNSCQTAAIAKSTQYKVYSVKRKNNKKKKKLSYNAREISSQILRATRSVGAAQVLVRAKIKVAQLQRCAVTGDYDENAVRAALAHAKRMVSCARKKLNHMEEEEQLQGKSRRLRKRTKDTTEEMLLKQQLQQLRRKNRREENNKIKEAEMRYMKEKIRQQQRENAENMADMTEAASGEIPLESTPIDSGAENLSAGTVDVLL